MSKFSSECGRYLTYHIEPGPSSTILWCFCVMLKFAGECGRYLTYHMEPGLSFMILLLVDSLLSN